MTDYGQFQTAPPQMTAAEQKRLIEHIEAYNTAVGEAELAQRRVVTAHAWLFCTCRRWFDRARPDVPPQAGCQVHGSALVSPDGREVV